MDKNTFIKIDNTRIKLSNIKNYGISEGNPTKDSWIEDNGPIGEYRRKIWFSDYITKRTVDKNWKKMDSIYEVEIYNGHDFEEFMDIDDSNIWESYINMDALKDEYIKVKEKAVQIGEQEKISNKKKNRFTAFFKNGLGNYGAIDEELSKQEVVIPIFHKSLEFINTKGKLYYNGEMFRCIGSPFKGAKISNIIVQDPLHMNGSYKEEQKMMCSQHRLCDKESVLIDSGELKKIYYDKKVLKQEVVSRRYLYITTYQNDNYQFLEDTCNIDDILRKLDDNLSI